MYSSIPAFRAVLRPPVVPLLSKYTAGDSLASATFTRGSTATYKDVGGTRQTAAINTPRDGHYIGGVRTLLLEGARTNHFLNSAAPVTQTSASLGTGTYTLWMEGTGSIAVAGTTATITGAGTATNGTPVTFVVTVAGTVTYTVTGSPTLAQSENGAFASSYIPTTGAAVTRSADSLMFPWTYAPAAGSFYVKLINLGTTALATAPGILCVCNSAAADPSLLLFHPNTASNVAARFGNGVSAQTSTAAPVVVSGDTLEAMVTLTAGGIAQALTSVNGAAEVDGAATAGLSLPGAWSASQLYLNNQGTTASQGFAAFQGFKTAAGVQSLATMRGL